eukprot:GCRY01001703.1.p1 GENE.GCRY01001703.1~~GCRY01001703.1.p1  ORF type:complete len:472 (+),score=72.83 GCRY01001703.1:215-1630(+)
MSITSDELNFLILRYLQESGFQHSAFVFGHESVVINSGVDGSNVPPGALISFIQKGLQYCEIERHVREDGTEIDCEEPFELLAPHICREKSEKREKKIKKEKKENKADKQLQKVEITGREVSNFIGHQAEVFVCQWNPKQPLLASGSSDATVRIWNLNAVAEFDGPQGEGVSKTSIVLNHKGQDVTALDWNLTGEYLATGSYDGHAFIWNAQGELIRELKRHTQAIFSLRWSRDGDYLLTGSVDKTAIVWDGKTGAPKQQFCFHTAPTLDVDWRNNNTLATCSSDNLIYVCKVGEQRPLRVFEGHKNEVNCIKWDPSGTLLASCSDDCTAKIWSMATGKLVHNLTGHTKEIYTVKWSPTGPGSANPDKPLLLASASFDYSIRIWDAETGKLRLHLTKHTKPVYSVCFSPDGNYVASGSLDRMLYVWSIATAEVIKSYQGPGGIFEVSWSSAGDKLACCFSDSTVSVIDLKL